MLAIFLDIETTGLDSNRHHAIDIAFKVIDVSTGELRAVYQSIVQITTQNWEKRDLTSMLINGYTWEQVVTGHNTQMIGQDIVSLFTELGVKRGEAVFICQNPAFDRGFFTQLVDVYTQERLQWPYHWLDLASMYWAMLYQRYTKLGQPFPAKLNLSKNEIAKEYGLPPEVEPHRAINGVDHLIQCYQAVMNVAFKC